MSCRSSVDDIANAQLSVNCELLQLHSEIFLCSKRSKVLAIVLQHLYVLPEVLFVCSMSLY